jgi:hypothetical protein
MLCDWSFIVVNASKGFPIMRDLNKDLKENHICKTLSEIDRQGERERET